MGRKGLTLGANCEMGVRITNAGPGPHLVRLRRAWLAPESLAFLGVCLTVFMRRMNCE